MSLEKFWDTRLTYKTKLYLNILAMNIWKLQ